MVRTSRFQCENRGSIPLGATVDGIAILCYGCFSFLYPRKGGTTMPDYCLLSGEIKGCLEDVTCKSGKLTITLDPRHKTDPDAAGAYMNDLWKGFGGEMISMIIEPAPSVGIIGRLENVTCSADKPLKLVFTLAMPSMKLAFSYRDILLKRFRGEMISIKVIRPTYFSK